jgi:hypothetical protein
MRVIEDISTRSRAGFLCLLGNKRPDNAAGPNVAVPTVHTARWMAGGSIGRSPPYPPKGARRRRPARLRPSRRR